MKRMAVIIATIFMGSSTWAQSQQTENGRKPETMPTVNDITMVAPALERYAQGPLADLWKRPGLTPREISKIITHLAFYSGWANAMSAAAVAQDVFAQRKIGTDQLPPASPNS